MLDIVRQIIILTLYTVMTITITGISSHLRTAVGNSFLSTYRLHTIPEYRIWIFVLGMIGSLFAVAYPIAFALQPQVAIWTMIIPLLSNVYGIIIGTIIVLASYLLLLLSITQIGRSETIPITTTTPALVTSGIYGWSRNPVYLSIYCLLLGISLILASALYLTASALFIINNHFCVLEEEKYLSAAYGPTYDNYHKNVPRYL